MDGTKGRFKKAMDDQAWAMFAAAALAGINTRGSNPLAPGSLNPQANVRIAATQADLLLDEFHLRSAESSSER